ncbi:MAG: hypothetical protein IKS90_05155 [Clostridia bacterium]|nr:hypothetical protein [Clostridia bacterium]
MKNQFTLFMAAVLVAAAMFLPACSKVDSDEPTQDAAGMHSPAPSAKIVDVSASPDLSAPPSSDALTPSASPEASASPDPERSIDGFMEGNIVDPSGIPDITRVLDREFPDYSIQSVTHEYYDGRQTYHIVLQGNGDLSRSVYVLSNGTIILPTSAD